MAVDLLGLRSLVDEGSPPSSPRIPLASPIRVNVYNIRRVGSIRRRLFRWVFLAWLRSWLIEETLSLFLLVETLDHELPEQGFGSPVLLPRHGFDSSQHILVEVNHALPAVLFRWHSDFSMWLLQPLGEDDASDQERAHSLRQAL